MHVNYTPEDIARFWGYIDKNRSNIFYNGTRCWEWTAGCFAQGYGMIRIQHKTYKTHRVSYELSIGEIPTGIQVLHHCDNRPCCNPLHFFLGDDKDNAADRALKGRNGDLRGERNGRAKLSDRQIEDIRMRYESGEKIIPLSKIFGVHFSHIYRIVSKRNRT